MMIRIIGVFSKLNFRPLKLIFTSLKGFYPAGLFLSLLYLTLPKMYKKNHFYINFLVWFGFKTRKPAELLLLVHKFGHCYFVQPNSIPHYFYGNEWHNDFVNFEGNIIYNPVFSSLVSSSYIIEEKQKSITANFNITIACSSIFSK